MVPAVVIVPRAFSTSVVFRDDTELLPNTGRSETMDVNQQITLW